MDRKYIIEIATSDFLTTKSAVDGGADRIELCANLAEGGTTPSYGHIRACREAFDILIYPIIRPRGFRSESISASSLPRSVWIAANI